MSESARRDSPLGQFLAERRPDPERPGLTLGERPFMGHVNLRGDPSDPDFLEAVASAVGVPLPVEANTVSEGGDVCALWLGPDEWLLLTPPGREAEVCEALGRSLAGTVSSVNDVSGGQTVINVVGERARDLLAKGCTLDLHLRVFGPGRCGQTLVAKAAVIVRQLDDTPSFDLVVRRSFADYLARWLEDAGREYGLAVVE